MNVTDLGTALVRRRAYAILVVLAAVLVAAFSWSTAKARHQTTTTLLVTAPAFGADANDITDRNPLLNINSNLAQLAAALATTMQSEQVAANLVASGASGDFTVSNVTSENPNTAALSAQIHFVVTGDETDSTLKSADLIVTEAKKQLDTLQAAAPAASRATLTMLSAPTTPTLVKSTKLRAAGSVAAIVLVVGFVLIMIVDARLVARATRLRHRTSVQPPSSGPEFPEFPALPPLRKPAAATTTATTAPAVDAAPPATAHPAPQLNGHAKHPTVSDPVS